MNDEKDGDQISVMLDYRCRRCGAPFSREATIECTNELNLNEQGQKLHHCDDVGVGIGELVGYHEI